MTRSLPRREFAALVCAALVTLSGCVTVHGERERIPAVRKAEAASALKKFTDQYNAAYRAADPTVVRAVESGPLLAISQGDLKVERARHPKGNPQSRALTLTDARFTIPRQAGWPKFFVADTHSNRDANRWLVVFSRSSAHAPWKATYLSLLSEDEVPEFALDEDGYAESVPTGKDSGLTVAPDALSAAYTSYLSDGKGDVFADGSATSALREGRKKHLRTPRYWTEYIDTPARAAGYAPLGLRTDDGGALVFFTSHHRYKQTMAKGYRPAPDERVRALMTGEAKRSITLTRINESAVRVPADPAAEHGAARSPAAAPDNAANGDKVVFLNRLEGVTAASGE